MKFSCPNCGTPLSATQEFFGMEVPCPQCTETVLVPVETILERTSPLPRAEPAAELDARKVSDALGKLGEHLTPLAIVFGFFLAKAIWNYPLHVNWLFAWLGAVVLFLGSKGFSTRGLPLTSDYHITGIPGKIIGILVMSIGAIFVYFDQIFAWIIRTFYE